MNKGNLLKPGERNSELEQQKIKDIFKYFQTEVTPALTNSTIQTANPNKAYTRSDGTTILIESAGTKKIGTSRLNKYITYEFIDGRLISNIIYTKQNQDLINQKVPQDYIDQRLSDENLKKIVIEYGGYMSGEKAYSKAQELENKKIIEQLDYRKRIDMTTVVNANGYQITCVNRKGLYKKTLKLSNHFNNEEENGQEIKRKR